MKRLILLALLALVSQASPVSAQPRTFNLDVVFPTYPGNSARWTDPAVKGAELIAIDNAVWHGTASLGQITLTGTTRTDWLDLDVAPTNGDCSAFRNAANSKLPPIPANTIRVLVAPPGTPCYSQESGLATSGATVITIGGASIDHETGHALGLPHSYEQQCQTTNGVVSCVNIERGGYSLMGQGTDTSVHERIMLGAFSPTYSLVTATTSQDVTLQFANTMTPGVKGIAIPQIVSVTKMFGTGPLAIPITVKEDHTIYVQYSRDSDPSRTGVVLWLTPDSLIDLDRVTSTARRRMTVGETFCEVKACVTVLEQSQSTDAQDRGMTGMATVRVTWNGQQPSSPAPTPVPAPAPAPTPTPNPAPATSLAYLGCEIDSANRVLPTMLTQGAGNTPATCVAKAKSGGFSFAGVQFGQECWAGNTHGTQGVASESDCNKPCSGDPSQLCGGTWRNGVYQVK